MNTEKIKELLDANELRNTKVRAEILTIFIKNNHALSYFDIKDKLKGNFDKVTVYRTIHKFFRKEINSRNPVLFQCTDVDFL